VSLFVGFAAGIAITAISLVMAVIAGYYEKRLWGEAFNALINVFLVIPGAAPPNSNSLLHKESLHIPSDLGHSYNKLALPGKGSEIADTLPEEQGLRDS